MHWLLPLIIVLALLAAIAALGSVAYARRHRSRAALTRAGYDPAERSPQSAPHTMRSMAFDHIGDGILIADMGGVLIDVNLAASTILGASQESFLGKRLDSLLPARSLSSSTSDSDWLPCEVQISVDGQPRWYEVSVSPIHGDGTMTGHVLILHDTTARRLSALKEKATKEREEEAIRLKSEFLAVISHEIRSPMHAVIGMTSMLLDTNLTDEQKDFIDTIRASGDSMLSIINNVLDFTKIEAGQIELEHLPFDPEASLENTLEIFAGEAAKKSIELTYALDEGAPNRIFGDVTRFRQVLTNLVGNAVKFTDHGEVAIQVSGEMPGANPLLHVQVRDTGIGIPADRLDRLFHSFSQVDASTARHYGGSGLGLVISKSLCEIMGGAIWVESQPGMGTTFHFTIAAPPAPFDQPAPAPPVALAGRSVLVVDDHASSCAMISRMLCDLHMKVSVADSGWSALELFETAGGFDAVLVDLHMPGMDGESLVRRIGAERALPRPRLVMLVTLTDGAIRGRAAELGLAACMTKPVKRSQLRNTLVDLFPGARPAPQPAPGSEFVTPLTDPLKLDVLLADDNLVGRRVTQAVLRRLGCDADVAGNGHEVLAALEMRRYDVVLMDVYMPDMDGLVTTQRIRSDVPPDRQPYIIALTANAMAEDRERCLNAGMDDFLAKPVRINSLNEALRRAATSSSAPDSQ